MKETQNMDNERPMREQVRKNDLVHDVQLIEADVKDIRWSSLGDHLRGNEDENRIARDICALIESFEPQRADSNVRSIWFRIPRGAVDDWMSVEDYREYAEMYDEPEEEVAAERLRSWAEWFPEEEYWHTLTTNSEDGWAIVCIDDRVAIEVVPGEAVQYENPSLRERLERIRACAAGVVAMASEGTYRKLIEESLPPRCRFGFVRRQTWWDRLGKDDLFDDAKIGVEEADELAELLLAQPDEEDIGHMPELCARQYFDALKGAYIAAGYIYNKERNWRRIPEDDSRAWYVCFGDDRDGSILELEQNSCEAFASWFDDDKRFFNHTFEILLGSGVSRVHLHPRHDERGWYCTLSGPVTWRAVDMARIWRHLNENGFPTYVYGADDIAHALRGEDDLLVVPFNESIWYRGNEHFGRHAVTCVHLPEEGAEAIIGDIEWVDEPVPQLKVRNGGGVR